MQIRLRFGRSRVRRVRRRESDVVSRGCRTASDAFRLIVDPRASEALCAPLHVLLSPQFLPRFIYCLVVLDLRVDAKPPVTVGWETILSLYSLAAFGSIWQHLAAFGSLIFSFTVKVAIYVDRDWNLLKRRI
jgi:hypothetical protein